MLWHQKQLQELGRLRGRLRTKKPEMTQVGQTEEVVALYRVPAQAWALGWLALPSGQGDTGDGSVLPGLGLRSWGHGQGGETVQALARTSWPSAWPQTQV